MSKMQSEFDKICIQTEKDIKGELAELRKLLAIKLKSKSSKPLKNKQPQKLESLI
jgi:hypothetical protein